MLNLTYETFPHLARLETIRFVLAIAFQNNWNVYKMNIKSTLLNGCLDEKVYFRVSLGYEDKVY